MCQLPSISFNAHVTPLIEISQPNLILTLKSIFKRRKSHKFKFGAKKRKQKKSATRIKNL